MAGGIGEFVPTDYSAVLYVFFVFFWKECRMGGKNGLLVRLPGRNMMEYSSLRPAMHQVQSPESEPHIRH